MNRYLERFLYGASALLLLGATTQLREPSRTQPFAVNELSLPAMRWLEVDDAKLATQSELLVRHDLFRAARRPTQTDFVTAQVGNVAEPPRQPAPVLSGIIGGPPWMAAFDAVPGHEGSLVVREGEKVGDYRLLRIGRDRVKLRGSDSTFTLTLRKPAQ